MANPDRGNVPSDALAVGATRHPTVPLFELPVGFVIPIIAIPLAFVTLTAFLLKAGLWGGAWLILIFPFTAAGRALISVDQNRPRVLWIAFKTGVLFTNKGRRVTPHLKWRLPNHLGYTR